jgi:hypothetical protein
MRALSLSVAALGLVAASCGCGGTITVPNGHNVDAELDDARAGAPHRVYYAGRAVADRTLSAVEARSARVNFMYGTCTIDVPADGGCGVPVEVQNFPFQPGQWRIATGCSGRTTVRGVPAVRQGGLTIFTRDTVVKIYAPTRAAERRVVAALRPIEGRPGLREPLPSPPAGQIQLVEGVCLVTPHGVLRRR